MRAMDIKFKNVSSSTIKENGELTSQIILEQVLEEDNQHDEPSVLKLSFNASKEDQETFKELEILESFKVTLSF